jgi:hypothetical protein
MNGGRNVVYKNSKLALFCAPLRFYTETDEVLFFQWLKAVSCITTIQGIGRELHLHTNNPTISHDDLLNLTGLTHSMKVLIGTCKK